MMVKPSVAELLTKVDNRFRLVSVTSKRARQIAEERHDEIANGDAKSEDFIDNPVTIAAEEIAEGKVKEVSKEEKAEEERQRAEAKAEAEALENDEEGEQE